MTDKEQTIQLAHGGGGRLTADWIRARVLSRFGEGPLASLPDAATVRCGGESIVFTTDSYVVSPLEFPGGDIGCLAVHGTVNDLAVAGARPQWLSLALILEEGLPLSTADRILDSIKTCADRCGVTVATGDTKVVERGRGDGMYINTAGIGTRHDGFELSLDRVEPGDLLIVSGPVGDHGMAVMAAREGIDIRPGPVSDTGPVHRLTAAITECAPRAVRFMRDPTRGGVAAVVNEMVHGRTWGLAIEETSLPTWPATRAAAEMLGIDLLNVACEGRVLALVDAASAEDILAYWRGLPEGEAAVIIGRVTDEAGRAVLETVTGGRRLIDVPLGENLPRIC